MSHPPLRPADLILRGPEAKRRAGPPSRGLARGPRLWQASGMRLAPALVLLLLATPALAREPVTAEEYEALTEGRTMSFGAQGQGPYGLEHYFPGRRVTWGWVGDDECLEGKWYPEGDPASPAICFRYRDGREPQCWRFWREGDGLVAEFLNDPADGTLYTIEESPKGLVCGGVGA